MRTNRRRRENERTNLICVIVTEIRGPRTETRVSVNFCGVRRNTFKDNRISGGYKVGNGGVGAINLKSLFFFN